MISTNTLCHYLFEQTVSAYGTLFNPIGLSDDTARQIQSHQLEDSSVLEGIYENLAAIYRYQYGDTQLEIIWDGKSHLDKFTEDWSNIYKEWLAELLSNRTFVKGILQMTVFNELGKNTFFIENGLKAIVNEYFDLKVLSRNGIKKLYVKMPTPASKVG